MTVQYPIIIYKKYHYFPFWSAPALTEDNFKNELLLQQQQGGYTVCGRARVRFAELNLTELLCALQVALKWMVLPCLMLGVMAIKSDQPFPMSLLKSIATKTAEIDSSLGDSERPLSLTLTCLRWSVITSKSNNYWYYRSHSKWKVTSIFRNCLYRLNTSNSCFSGAHEYYFIYSLDAWIKYFII